MSTLSRSFPVARKTHRCTSCERLILKGEQYHRWKGTGDLWFGIVTAKECAECCKRYDRAVPVAMES